MTMLQKFRGSKEGQSFIHFIPINAAVVVFSFLALCALASAPAVVAASSVRPSPLSLNLSRTPSTEEIMAAGQLGGILYPTREVSDKVREEKINLSFGEAMQAWNKHEYPKAIGLFRKHVEEYPDSPWVSEAVLHIGCDAYYNGRYTEAERSFQWIISENTGKNFEGATAMVNKAKLRLANLRVAQNDFQGAGELYRDLMQESSDWRYRTYASHWIQRLSRYKSHKRALLNCGTKALACLLEKKGKKDDAKKVSGLRPGTDKGQTLKVLSDIGATYGYHFAALRISPHEIGALPLPAIMHITGKNKNGSGHYWILNKVSRQGLELFDPQSGRRFNQSVDEFAHEWNGNVLIFSDKEKLPGTRLDEQEMAEISGGCCGEPAPERNLGDGGDICGDGAGGGGDGGGSCEGGGTGSPAWQVNLINLNLYMHDKPLWYVNPIGPSVEIKLSYNSQSAINQYEPFGNKWQFNYGSFLVVDTGGVVTIFMPDGRRDVYSPDGNGGYEHAYQAFNTLTKIDENHFELLFPDGTVYVYNIPAGTSSQQPFLVEIRDAHGQKLTFSYNSEVQLTMITDALGRTTSLTYNSQGLVTQVNDPFGRSASFEYDANRNLTKITDMGGYWALLSYDKDAYITSVEKEQGTWSFYIEPADGIVANSNNYPPPGDAMWENYRITITNPMGGKEEYFYYGGCDEYDDSGCGYTWYVKPREYITWGNQETNNYRNRTPKFRYFTTETGYSNSEISKVIYPEGEYLEYGYDDMGNPISITDSGDNTTWYIYNGKGNFTSVIDPKDTKTTRTYADNGIDLLQITDGRGTVTLTYNNTHDVTSVTDRLGHTTNLSYNEYGQLSSLTDPLSTVTTLLYDANHFLQQVSKGGKTVIAYTYDSVGRVKTYTDETGLTLTYDYNNLDSVTKVTYPDGRFISYTYSSCCPYLLDSVTDRAGRTTSYKYDSLGRRTEVINPEGGITKYVYDANGNVIRLIDMNNHATTFDYNFDNFLIKKTYADGSYTAITYDSMALTSVFTNARGIKTTYTYDENHNLLNRTYSDGTPGVAYQYDSYNLLTQRQDGIGTYLYDYNANSQLTSIDGPWTDDTLTLQYDAAGRMTALVPEGGRTVTYTYDALNRPTGITIGTNIYSYAYTNASPLVQSLTRPNGSVTAYQYDSLNRLTGISNKNSSAAIINQDVFSYNSQDVRSSETITNGNSITTFQKELITYDLNTVNQLLRSTNPARTFLYDADGNMTQGYTPEGFMFTAAYDAENRLKSVEYTDGGGMVHRNEYYYSGDGFLAREKRFENSVLVQDIRFIRYNSLVLQERDGNNAVVREYDWGQDLGGGIGGLLNLRQGGQDYTYLYDGKGNVIALLDATQSVVGTYTYDTFGNLMVKTGTVDQPYGFSTKPYDEKTGLSYYGFRFYSPAMGRWITRDPLQEAGGINLYAFVKNNPVNRIDPLGLDGCKDWFPGWVCKPFEPSPPKPDIKGKCPKGQIQDLSDPENPKCIPIPKPKKRPFGRSSED